MVVTIVGMAAFLSYLGGPGAPPPVCPEALPCWRNVDFDGDEDVDLADFAVLPLSREGMGTQRGFIALETMLHKRAAYGASPLLAGVDGGDA